MLDGLGKQTSIESQNDLSQNGLEILRRYEKLVDAVKTERRRDQDRLQVIFNESYALNDMLDKLELEGEQNNAISGIQSYVQDKLLSPMQDWRSDKVSSLTQDLHSGIYSLRDLYMQGVTKQEPAKSATKKVISKETLECVVHEFVQDDVIVIIMINGLAEKRIMSRERLARVGIVKEGQPFNISVIEEVVSGTVRVIKSIEPLCNTSGWSYRQIRPDLNPALFKRKPKEA